MKFVDRIKEKVADTKVKVAEAKGKRDVRDIYTRMQTFPLCSALDAFHIVDSEMHYYFGRSDIIDLDIMEATDEDFQNEDKELQALLDPKREFLETILNYEFGYEPESLKGSIGSVFNDKLLRYARETDFAIEEEKFIEILTALVHQSSGSEIDEHFTSWDKEQEGATKTPNLFHFGPEYVEKYFPNLKLPELEKEANRKFQSYHKLRALCEPFIPDEDHESTSDRLGNPPVILALGSDTVGPGTSVDVFMMGVEEPTQEYLGQASVTRMIEQHIPHVLSKAYVTSLRNLSTQMNADSELHWHFCEDGIIELTLQAKAVPRWLPAKNIKELIFGDGYDGLSTNGRTEFERFYLYMMVRTTTNQTFTLFKFLSRERQKAMEMWADISGDTLSLLANYYNIKISDETIDISKHYKTTQTYTTTWFWGQSS